MLKLFSLAVRPVNEKEVIPYHVIADDEDFAVMLASANNFGIKSVNPILYDIQKVSAITELDGYRISLEKYEEPKDDMEKILLMAGGRVRLFCVLATIDDVTYIRHTVAQDSQEAFRKVKFVLEQEGVTATNLSAYIVRFIEEQKYKVNLVSAVTV